MPVEAFDNETNIGKSWYVPPRPKMPRGWLVYSSDFILAALQGCLAEPEKVRRTTLWLVVGSTVRCCMAIAQGLIMLIATIPIISPLLETFARVFTRNAAGFLLRACYWKAKLQHLGQDTLISQNVEIWGADVVSIGSRCHLDKDVRLAAGERRHGQHGSIKIGNFVHLGPGVHIAGRGHVEIGDFTGISANVHLYSASNVIESCEDPGQLVSMSHMAPYDQQVVLEAPIVIEEYAFIGMMTRVMPGVRVGHGAVIHSNCHVTRDVPPFANIGGVAQGRQIGWRKPRRESPRLVNDPVRGEDPAPAPSTRRDGLRKRASRSVDKREVYKNRKVVATYDRRLYFGLSHGLFFEREASLFRGLFPSQGLVFDCPCGTGKLARALEDHPGLRLIGGDISPLMVARAQQTGLYEGVAVVDFSRTPFQDELFDVIFVSRFFMLFPELDGFLAEIRRILKPNGLLIFDSIRRSIHNFVHRTIGTTEGWNYPRSTDTILETCHRTGFERLERRSAFLLSTGTMNRLPAPLFKVIGAMERALPESMRVMEVYKTRKIPKPCRISNQKERLKGDAESDDETSDRQDAIV